jgi:hypothetical protein
MLHLDIGSILSELSFPPAESPAVTSVTTLLPVVGNNTKEHNTLESLEPNSLLPVLPPLPPKNTIPAENSNWKPTFHAWLEGDTLHTTGVTDDLAEEIIKLTTDDLPLQRRLLKLYIGTYSGPWWERLRERWEERASIMQYDGGLTKDDAEYQAAVCLRAEMFIDELRGTA